MHMYGYSWFYYKFMKSPSMRTIIGSSGNDYVLIIFNFMALRVAFLGVIYSGQVSMTPILEEGLIQC